MLKCGCIRGRRGMRPASPHRHWVWRQKCTAVEAYGERHAPQSVKEYLMTPWPVTLVLVLGMLGLGVSQARTADVRTDTVSGLWAVAIEQPRAGCRWEGHVRLAQKGKRIAGSGEAKPVARGRHCAALNGEIKGTRQGARVRFGFATGRLGTADFTGTVGGGGWTMDGRWRTRSAAGRWRAERAR